MPWIITPSFTYDTDAQAYITAVETADGQALETGVKDAINAFVVGCKADGIWAAIKASCILAGARTLSGALVPLVGAAPTNFNFVAGDYNRKTGLVGNGSNKFINSNRSNSADPQNSAHRAVYITGTQSNAALFMSTPTVNTTGDSYFYSNGGTINTAKLNTAGTPGPYASNVPTGLLGASRAASASFLVRNNGTNYVQSVVSVSPLNENLQVFGVAGFYSNARLAFYSIGESLDLALLDTRVTTLINALAAAIP